MQTRYIHLLILLGSGHNLCWTCTRGTSHVCLPGKKPAIQILPQCGMKLNIKSKHSSFSFITKTSLFTKLYIYEQELKNTIILKQGEKLLW